MKVGVLKHENLIILTLVLAMLAFLPGACVSRKQIEDLSAHVTILPIMEARKAQRPCSLEGPKGVLNFWTPSKSEVLKAEEHLADFLADETPKELTKQFEAYNRQYVGLTFGVIAWLNISCSVASRS